MTGGLAVLGLLIGFAGRESHAADLLSNFRLQITLCLTTSGILLALLRHFRKAGVFLGLGLSLTWTLVHVLPKPLECAEEPLTVVTLNLLSANRSDDSVVRYLKHASPDLIALQEVTPWWASVLNAELSNEWPYHHLVPKTGNFGLAVFSRYPLIRSEVLHLAGSDSFPTSCTKWHHPTAGMLTFYNLHPPAPLNHRAWTHRNEILTSIASRVRDEGYERTLVAGDLNCTPWSPWFADVTANHGLQRACSGVGITWRPHGSPLTGLALDHILSGNGLPPCNYSIGPDVGSDHRPVLAAFCIR